jgi:hypothetical protein
MAFILSILNNSFDIFYCLNLMSFKILNGTVLLWQLKIFCPGGAQHSLSHTDPALGGAQVSLNHTDPAPGHSGQTLIYRREIVKYLPVQLSEFSK